MAYDKLKWHLDGEFPNDVPPENAGTHIGMFLTWCFRRGWSGNSHKENEPEAVLAVIEGRMTGREFIETYCDGTFNEEDLSEEGNVFAGDYYATDDYEDDYGNTFIRRHTPTIYHVKDDRESYERIAKVLDKRYQQWTRRRKKRKQGEIELEATGTAKGILDLRTCELIFTEPDFRIGPKTSRRSFLESSAGKLLDQNHENLSHANWKIPGSPKLGGVPMDVIVYFKGDKVYLLSLSIADTGSPANPWDPQYQAERNRLNNEWLTSVFGTAREFSWGSIQASYDQRSGTSCIFITYA